MNVIDTNIWIYCHDKRDSDKQDIARRLIDQARPWALPWQVGCEFLAAARKLELLGFSPDDAWAALADMQTIASEILLPEPPLWTETRTISERFTLSFWDALLVAACLRAGVKTLYTEDMGAPRTVEGLSLVNPFLAAAKSE